MIKFTLRLVVFLLFLTVTGEIFFRTILLASNQPLLVQEEEYKITHFDSETGKDGVYTSGRFTLIRAPWHVNKHGFIADIDYKPASEKDKPRIVVIGDSFVTGFIIPWEQHLAHVLQDLTEDSYDVYSLGSSGGMLIHYTQIARYAADKFDPDIIIFMLNDSDLESGIYNYNTVTPFNLNLVYKDGEFIEKPSSDFQVKKFKRFMRKSAIARYLWRNKSFSIQENVTIPAYSNEVVDEEKNKILQASANYCIKKLVDEHPEREFVFVMDADRTGIYQDEGMPDIVPESKNIRKASAEEGGYYYDLTKMFYDDYQINDEKFNWDHDFHWTPRAHNLVANSIYQFLLEKDIISN
jgi:hypothetical protein